MPARALKRIATHHVVATTMVGVIAIVEVQAQPAQSGSGTTPTSAPSVQPSQPAVVGQSGAIGTGLATPSPAMPTPNPNLTTNAALPDRRGFARIEPFYVYPWVGVGFGNNSNLTGTAANPISSSFAVVTPRITAELKKGAHIHSLSYGGSYGRYFASAADNYNDHEITAATANQFTARLDLSATLYYLDRVDPRGLLARPQSDVPDHFTAWGTTGTLGYGAKNAQGRAEMDFGLTEKGYDNNRLITQSLDVSTYTLAGRFLYRLAPRTRALGEIRVTDYNYRVSNRDNIEYKYLGGVTWDLAAATSGTVKFGWMTKNFKDQALQDFSGPSLEASARWSPLTYSVVDVIARRGAIDSAGLGLYTVDTSLGVQWTHRWGPFLSTRSGLTHTNSEFRGLSRKDNSTVVQIGAFTDLRTWMRVGMDYQFVQRSSTDSTVEFKRNIVMMTLGLTI